jgi:hypothetical protein
LFGDGQAQSGAAKLAQRGLVGMLKALEHMALEFAGNAAASVYHFKQQ